MNARYLNMEAGHCNCCQEVSSEPLFSLFCSDRLVRSVDGEHQRRWTQMWGREAGVEAGAEGRWGRKFVCELMWSSMKLVPAPLCRSIARTLSLRLSLPLSPPPSHHSSIVCVARGSGPRCDSALNVRLCGVWHLKEVRYCIRTQWSRSWAKCQSSLAFIHTFGELEHTFRSSVTETIISQQLFEVKLSIFFLLNI